MNKHLIIGYGYCGYFLAQALQATGEQISAVCRSKISEREIAGVAYYYQSIEEPLATIENDSILYYLIPPLSLGKQDILLQQFLNKLPPNKLKKIIYFGSSAVYGDHQGNWVNEQSICNLIYDRQHRRLDAERLLKDYCKANQISLALLRIAGIYGPDRLPVQAAINEYPLIIKEQAPYTNHIFINDLIRIALEVSRLDNLTQETFNIADGRPQSMGTLQQLIAQILQVKAASYQSFDDIWLSASPMKQEFMNSSKRLIIDKIKKKLPSDYNFTYLTEGIKLSIKYP